MKRLGRNNLSKIAVVGFLLTICVLATYYFHFILETEIVFTHLFYIPLILASLWWLRRGILVAVFLALLLLVSHILSPIEGPIGADVTRALMFVIVATAVAIPNKKRLILEDKLLIHSKILEQQVEKRTSALKEAEEKERAILNGIADAIVVLDKDLNITWANEIALHSYGVVLGKKCYQTYRWLKKPCADCIARKTYTDGVARKSEEENILKDGDHINFIVSCFPIKDPDGKITSIVEVLHNITEHKKAEEQIRASLKEKEVLVREIHHRVKNNLQVISSLLVLSALCRHDQQAISFLTTAQSKIYTMALIHSQLYETEEFNQIEMGSHIQTLIRYLTQVYSEAKRITPVIKIPEFYLSITHAIPCALVLNELISNALQHAFQQEQKGMIEISMQRSATGTVFIKVKDDGIGMSDKVDIYTTDSLGLKLVRNLVQKQLKGEIQLKRDKGTEFTVKFKALEEETKYV